MTNKPELCYVFVPGARPGKRIGIVKRGDKGYFLTDFDTVPETSDEAIKGFVAEFNERLGVSPAEAEAMKIGSMFGWDCPGAQAA